MTLCTTIPASAQAIPGQQPITRIMTTAPLPTLADLTFLCLPWPVFAGLLLALRGLAVFVRVPDSRAGRLPEHAPQRTRRPPADPRPTRGAGRPRSADPAG